ncbi:MAG: pyridoxine 5'-phosphate synthase [Deltaproteobacteria bacterium]|nr:pyridoxine 5'-phosphate synthase [Deltaproteobacteria bacterium]
MKRLHVNIDHCATIRQARGTSYPDPVWAAAQAELAGAHGITAHLREDRRHIQDRDMRLLRQTVRTVLNMEMAATEEMIALALELKPEIVTLVPERREERTTEGGLDLKATGLGKAVERLKSRGIIVSLFIDPDTALMNSASEIGADMIELHTGDYCEASSPGARDLQLDRLTAAAAAAEESGLRVAAGHGLDYPNVVPVAAIPQVEELNIGHAIIARAIFSGLDLAVRDMLALIDGE